MPGSPEWVGVRAWVQNSSFHPQISFLGLTPSPPHPFPLKVLEADSVLCSHSPWLKSPLARWKSLEILTRTASLSRPDLMQVCWKATSGVQFGCFSPFPRLEAKAIPHSKPHFCPEEPGKRILAKPLFFLRFPLPFT